MRFHLPIDNPETTDKLLLLLPFVTTTPSDLPRDVELGLELPIPDPPPRDEALPRAVMTLLEVELDRSIDRPPTRDCDVDPGTATAVYDGGISPAAVTSPATSRAKSIVCSTVAISGAL